MTKVSSNGERILAQTGSGAVRVSGGERTRTADFYVANVALYQLSYTPDGESGYPAMRLRRSGVSGGGERGRRGREAARVAARARRAPRGKPCAGHHHQP